MHYQASLSVLLCLSLLQINTAFAFQGTHMTLHVVMYVYMHMHVLSFETLATTQR